MPFDNPLAEITVDTPASLILELAIKVIERPERWCRNSTAVIHSDGSVAHCAWGAVVEARDIIETIGFGSPEGFDLAHNALQETVALHAYTDIARLNDDPRTTHAAVLEVMRQAAHAARGKR